MIRHVNDKTLKLPVGKGDSSKVRSDLIRKIGNLFTRLHAAKEIKDMNAPGLNLHELKGNRKGTWSGTVKGNRGITFRFENGDAFDVKPEDYH